MRKKECLLALTEAVLAVLNIRASSPKLAPTVHSLNTWYLPSYYRCSTAFWRSRRCFRSLLRFLSFL